MSLPKIFLLDVDGVMTTGHFLYSIHGKEYKSFGPDDSDALAVLNKYIEIQFITGDKRGFEISKKRINDDMGYPISLVSTIRRIDWIKEKFVLNEVIYMGDGLLDSIVFNKVGYAICPQNSLEITKKYAHYISPFNGGNRAVADACLHIMEKFFVRFDPKNIEKKIKIGEWNT